MKKILMTAIAAAIATPALAAPIVDGTVNLGEYGAATASVATNPTAPINNFGAPTNEATAGYDVYLNSTDGKLFGAIVQTGGVAAGAFANLYFALSPSTGPSGSNFGIEVTNQRAFIPGVAGYQPLGSAVTFATSTTGGLNVVEFSIDHAVFYAAIAGITAAQPNYFGPGGWTPQDLRLNMSQSLSYSAAGGQAFYGNARLGTFSIAAGVPEPTTWMMMILGFGAIGFGMRRKNVTTRVRYA